MTRVNILHAFNDQQQDRNPDRDIGQPLRTVYGFAKQQCNYHQQDRLDVTEQTKQAEAQGLACLLYTSPSPRDS